ncbi:MAG: HEAT repeat domain-containing protein [Lysobacterales bacterium]
MNRLQRLNLRAGLLLVLLVGIGMDRAALAGQLQLPSSGWASWEVPAAAGTGDWCCLAHYGRPARECPLDGPERGYSKRSEDQVDAVRLYARFDGGQLRQLQMFAASCPVTARSAIQDLGAVAVEPSLHWLQQQLAQRPALREDLTAALSAHAGEAAQAALLALAAPGAPRPQRQDALFWLALNRGAAGASALEPFLSQDADPEIRQHAAFALSQTQSPRRSAALIRQGQQDPSSEVRSQAWFWLAQTGAAEAESAIASALKAEKDAEVRHQAIFALSQLPDDRAAPALGRVLEDRRLSLDDRKQALFWLGQSDSELAQRYLAEVLGSN